MGKSFKRLLHLANLILLTNKLCRNRTDFAESKLTKLCGISLINEFGTYEEDKLIDMHESSFDESASQIFKGSENSFSSASIKSHLLPEVNKKLRQW